jgi:magnesium transporter
MIAVYHWDAKTSRGHWGPAAELLRGAPTKREQGEAGDIWWVDLEAPDEAEEQRVLAEWLPVHPLTLEDVTKPRLDPKHRPHLPKVEEFADYLFVIVNPLDLARLAGKDHGTGRHGEIDVGPADLQLSAVLTHHVLVTHHLAPLPSVDRVKGFLERHPTNCRRGPDYVFHLILDELVDEYAPVLDKMISSFEAIEEQVYRRPERGMTTRLLRLKRTVVLLRRTLVLEREVLARMMRGEFELIDEREQAYYRNVYDHLVRYTDLVESTRDMLGDLMQSHLAAISNRLSETMKVLTMISTIVLPMTLIAGIYGMNFERNVWPDFKDSPWGFAGAIAAMVLTGLVALGLFKWRKWI